MTTRMIIVRNSDDRDSDRYFLVPEGMDIFYARDRVDVIIVQAKEDMDHEWDNEVVLDRLAEAGFREVDGWVHSFEDL